MPAELRGLMAGDRKPVGHVSHLSLSRCDGVVMSHGRTVMFQLPQLVRCRRQGGPGRLGGRSRPANPEAKAKVRELEGSPGIVGSSSHGPQLSSHGSHCLPS